MENVYRTRKIKKLILSLLLLFLCLGWYCMCESKTTEKVSMNSPYYLSSEEIEELKIQISEGNGDAALKIANYISLYLEDYEGSQKYYKLGADNGNTICQYNYALYLLEEQNDSEEAIDYLIKAAKNGHKRAISELTKLGIQY